jgi:hypothetical protein
MVRKFLYAAALAASTVVGLATPAAAQSYGSVTLSVGPRYGAYNNGYNYGYRDDRRYHNDRAYDWRARERWERRLRWEREREWRERARREYRWHQGRDRDWDRGRDWNRRGY